MELKNKRVLVTGGSSRIGLALAHALIARGARVVITGRRRSVLDDALRSLDSATGVCADVEVPRTRPRWTRRYRRWADSTSLVNNAGGVPGWPAGEHHGSRYRADGDRRLARASLVDPRGAPALRASGDAMVVNVASGIALVGAPLLCNVCRGESRSGSLWRGRSRRELRAKAFMC